MSSLDEKTIDALLKRLEGEVDRSVEHQAMFALVHAGRLILPYAMSDQCTSFATVPLEELLSELKSQPPDSLL